MKVIEKFNLENFNAYRLKSFCSKAFFPENENDLNHLFSAGSERSSVIIGHGNNIILSKEWYDQSFVIFNSNFNAIKLNKNVIIAETGASLKDVSNFALINNYSGFESFYDIPGSIGGAVVMNAGTNGSELKDNLLYVRYFDLSKCESKLIENKDIGFEYRNSIFQKQPNLIVIEAAFELQKGNALLIENKMQEIKNQRWLKQPREYPNCGSVFKRPAGYYVGPLIDELGLKGFSIGGAKVSEKHSGFIINTGNAKATDILDLIDLIKEKVNNKYHISLEVEQKII